jgi:hypothetical protein
MREGKVQYSIVEDAIYSFFDDGKNSFDNNEEEEELRRGHVIFNPETESIDIIPNDSNIETSQSNGIETISITHKYYDDRDHQTTNKPHIIIERNTSSVEDNYQKTDHNNNIVDNDYNRVKNSNVDEETAFADNRRITRSRHQQQPAIPLIRAATRLPAGSKGYSKPKRYSYAQQTKFEWAQQYSLDRRNQARSATITEGNHHPLKYYLSRIYLSAQQLN